MRRTLLILSMACFVPAIGQAQHHAGTAMPTMSGTHFAAAPAPIAAPHVASPHLMAAAAPRPIARVGRTSTHLSATTKSTTHSKGWNHSAHGTNTYAGRDFYNCDYVGGGYFVPGLGFDYAHYFAVHPNASSGFGCQNYGYGSYVGGGAYYPVPTYVEQSAEAQPAAEEAAPAGQAAQGEEAPPQDAYSNPPSRMAPQPTPKPQAEYVFVRRDGSLVFAVAYSWINDRLQYVTSEGLRRTIPVDTIDLSATQQFNEQRGVPIQPPA